MNAKIYNSLLILVSSFVVLLFPLASRSQTWAYDFGTGTGTYISTSGVNTTFLPQPLSGNEQLSIGAVAQGSGFYLDNPGLPLLGSGSELRSTASTGVSVNKFSLYGYTASKAFYTKFPVLFGDVNGNAGPKAGDWFFYQGSGALYSNIANASTTLNQSFVSLRFSFANQGIMNLAYNNGTSWINLNTFLSANLEQGKIYTIEIFGNNTNVATDYNNNGMHSLAADRWDLWIDGALVASGLNSGGMANNVNIDSWLFAGEHSTVNFATIFLDDIVYSNGLPGSTLPISLISFTGSRTQDGIKFNWATASEINNDYFTIEYSEDAENFLPLSNVQGSGTSNQRLDYETVAQDPGPSARYFRLKQTDFDGAFTYSDVITIDPLSGVSAFNLVSVHNSESGLTVTAEALSGTYLAEVFGVDGAKLYSVEVTPAGNTIDLPYIPSKEGIYFLRLRQGEQAKTLSFFAK
jgi:hypothetical protein